VAATTQEADVPSVEGAVPITLRINGTDRALRVDPRVSQPQAVASIIEKAARGVTLAAK
jgi:hypothetical protein